MYIKHKQIRAWIKKSKKALFRAAEGGYFDDLTKDEQKTMRQKKEKPKKGLDKKHEQQDNVFGSFGYKAPCPW